MEQVVTVHGIWTEGRWQEEVAPVLYPHFEPTSLKYRSYRHLGPLDILLEPWVLFPGLALWIAAFAWWRPDTTPGLATMALFALSLVAIVALANLFVPVRLAKTLNLFLDSASVNGLRDSYHIIAHSLGSYIVCTALKDDDPTFMRHVVLAGCVVNENFPWADVVAKKKFNALRNEVAGGDIVATAAALLRWRVPNFGSAGRKGFTNVDHLVHTVASPNESCSITPDTASVHNYISAKKGHSGVLTAIYAKYYWLPFFWNIEPSEFRQFLDACRELMTAYAAAGSPAGPPPGGDFNTQAAAFLSRTWRWAGGTLPQYLANRGTPVPNAGDQTIVLFNLCLAVGNAQVALGSKIEKWRTNATARQSPKSVEFDEAIEALYPPTAVARAYLAYKK